MSATTNLQLPYLEAAQAQKHVTVNESLRLRDALVQPAARSCAVSTQPASPADGDVYVLPPGKTGAVWGAMANPAIAFWRDGAWAPITPREGGTFFVRDEDRHVVFSGATWTPLQSMAQSQRNRLTNAAFTVDQRAFTSVADDAYCFDRWYVLASTGAVTIGALSKPETGRPTGRHPPHAAGRDRETHRVGADRRKRRHPRPSQRSRRNGGAGLLLGRAGNPHGDPGTDDAAGALLSDVVSDWSNGGITAGGFFNATTLNVIATGASTPAPNTWTEMAQIRRGSPEPSARR